MYRLVDITNVVCRIYVYQIHKIIYETELFRDELESTRCFGLTTIGMYNAPEQKSCGFGCGTCVKVFVGFGFIC